MRKKTNKSIPVAQSSTQNDSKGDGDLEVAMGTSGARYDGMPDSSMAFLNVS